MGLRFRKLLQKRLLWILIGAVILGVGILLVSKGSTPWLSLFRKAQARAAIFVNGEIIRYDEFEQAYRNLLNRYRASLVGSERLDFERSLAGAPGAYYQLALKSQLAEDLIRRTLLQQAARELEIGVSPTEVLGQVRQQLRRFLEQNGVPAEQIEQALQDPKTYQSAFTQDLREQTYWQILEGRLRERVVGPLDPAPAELRQYYNKYRLRYYVPELVHVRHILIRVSEDAPQDAVKAALQKIEGVRWQWEQGADFADLARQHSEDALTAPNGGDYGWIQQGDPSGEAFVSAAFSLREPGEVSAPIRTKRGFHLIQLVERRPAQGETYEDAAEEVRYDYLIEKAQDRYQSWYERYRAEAEVRIELPILAAYQLEARDREAALRAYEQIRTQEREDDPYLGYYIARLYREKLGEAQQEMKRLESGGGHEGEIAQLRAQIHDLTMKIVENLRDILARGQADQGVFEAILELTPEDMEMRFAFARFLLGHGRWDEAAEQLKRVLEAQPEHLDALKAYGQLLIKMNEFAQAAEYLERALASYGQGRAEERLELQLQLAQAYRKLGRWEEARQRLEGVLEADPKHFGAQRELGMLALEQGDYPSAISFLEVALQGAPLEEGAELQAMLGKAYLGKGDLEQAERMFRKALEAPSPPAEAYRELGELSQKRGEVEQALSYYRKGLEQVGRWEERERLAKRILELIPDDVETRFALAELYQNRRHYEGAIEQYRAILELQPNSLPAWRSLGEAYLGLQQYAEAVLAFQQALPWAKPPEEKAGLWARILEADRAQSEVGLTQRGLEALYQLARLSISMGQDQEAAGYLAQLMASDPFYRAGEVAQLVEQLRQRGVRVILPQTP